MISVGLMVLIYGGSGLAEIAMWRKFVPQFLRWNFPAWMAWVNPAIKILAAVLIAMPQTRVVGAMLCCAVAVGAVLTVLRFRERAMYKAALPVLVVTALIGVQLVVWPQA